MRTEIEQKQCGKLAGFTFPFRWSGHWKRVHTPIYRPDGSVLEPKPKKAPLTAEKLRQKRTPRSWLTSVVDGLDVGIEVDGRPIHANTSYAPGHPKHGIPNAQIVDLINERLGASREQRKATRFPSLDWSTDNLMAHCDGQLTLFYCGRANGLMLLALDVDNKNCGSATGAAAFCERISSLDLFNGLYHEPSRGGKGRHGNFILDPCGLDVEAVKSLMKIVAIWANEEAQNFDVENVEIKGLPPDTTISDGRVQHYKAGVLATVPRGLVDRFEEVRKMPVIPANQLRKLVSPAYLRNLGRKPEHEEPCQTDTVAPSLKVVLPCAGSTRGKHISDEMLQDLDEGGCYSRIASSLLGDSRLGDSRLSTTTRAVATAIDLAILLMILEFCTNNANENGGLPEKRVAELWKALFGCRDIERGYNHHRFKVLRDFLSDRGMIDWTDSTYRVGWHRKDGKYVPGACMKWQLDQKVMNELQQLRARQEMKEPHVSSGVVNIAEKTTPAVVYRGEASSMETRFKAMFTECLPEQQIRPVAVFRDPRFTFRPPDCYPALPFYERQMAA